MENKKSYVGLSKDIAKRLSHHKMKSSWKVEPNKPLYRAIQKYGVESFSFDILEKCPITEMASREHYWIEKLDSMNNGYNLTNGGEGTGAYDEILYKRFKISVVDNYKFYPTKKSYINWWEIDFDTNRKLNYSDVSRFLESEDDDLHEFNEADELDAYKKELYFIEHDICPYKNHIDECENVDCIECGESMFCQYKNSVDEKRFREEEYITFNPDLE